MATDAYTDLDKKLNIFIIVEVPVVTDKMPRGRNTKSRRKRQEKSQAPATQEEK